MKVFKYPINRARNEFGVYPVSMPANAKILSVAVVQEEVVIYATVPDSTDKMVKRSICVLGTGKEIPDKAAPKKFLGTVVQEPFVWHVFIEED